MTRAPDWTWEAVRRAAAGRSGWKRTRKGERRGPCQCGGERDRAWARRSGSGKVVAGCNAGCNGPDVIRWLTGDAPADDSRSGSVHRGQHSDPEHWREDRRESPPEPRGSPLTAQEPVGDPAAPSRREARERKAARHWRLSEPIPTDPGHPARQWAARRNLWRPGDAWPDSLRWLPARDRGGSIVALFAPLGSWADAAPALPAPPGVQLVHVGRDGLPAKDRGGLNKRSHGRMKGVCLIGDPLPKADRGHVVEGVADGLAVAARESGAVVIAGGKHFDKLADPLARIGLPVRLWPDGDDPEALPKAREAARTLRKLGIAARIAAMPDGADPAKLAGPFDEPPWRWPPPPVLED